MWHQYQNVDIIALLFYLCGKESLKNRIKFFTKSYQNLGSPFVPLFVIIEADVGYIKFF